jgi:hypothetical protein
MTYRVHECRPNMHKSRCCQPRNDMLAGCHSDRFGDRHICGLAAQTPFASHGRFLLHTASRPQILAASSMPCN